MSIKIEEIQFKQGYLIRSILPTNVITYMISTRSMNQPSTISQRCFHSPRKQINNRNINK